MLVYGTEFCTLKKIMGRTKTGVFVRAVVQQRTKDGKLNGGIVETLG
jgi:hypothetical protein